MAVKTSAQPPVKITPAYVATVQKEAQSGNATAQFNLAVLYHNGTGVKQDDQKSIFWMKKAAKSGDHDAPLNLYAIYTNGTGVKKDLKQAAQWGLIAAKAGNPRAAFVMADLYRHGTGVPQSTAKSNFWLLRGMKESGKLKPAPVKPSKKPFNTVAAILSGITGLGVFVAFLFVYYKWQKRNSSRA